MNFRYLNAKHGYHAQTPLSCHEPARTIGFVWELESPVRVWAGHFRSKGRLPRWVKS